MTRKGRVFFHPIDGSGSLTISWTSSPKGDAVEAKTGSGVGFFSESGELLCVIFDEVQSEKDHQILEFNRDRIELTVKNAKASYTATQKKAIARSRKKHPPKNSRSARSKDLKK